MRFYGEAQAGSFADYVSVPEALVALKPTNLTFTQAATVPLSGRTALQALRDGGQLKAGDKVLINGASGGVGTFAVQIARAFGAKVTAVCSRRNAERVRSLGADRVIDYKAEDFTAGPGRYDVVLDLVGDHSVSALRAVLTKRGTLVLASGNGGRVLGPMLRILWAAMLSPFVSQKLGSFPASLGREDLDSLRVLIEEGRVTPEIDRSYPLADVPEALRYLAFEHARAKIAITVKGDDKQ